jgi:hypothetical protein
MNNTKVGETVAIVLVVTMTVIVTMCLAEIMVVKRMSRQSLEGYKGHAIYKTNSVGEVTIDKLSWEKK